MSNATSPDGINNGIVSQATGQRNHVQGDYECCLFTPADAQRPLQQIPKAYCSSCPKVNIALELYNQALEPSFRCCNSFLPGLSCLTLCSVSECARQCKIGTMAMGCLGTSVTGGAYTSASHCSIQSICNSHRYAIAARPHTWIKLVKALRQNATAKA